MAMPGIVIRIGADTKDAVDGINRVERALGKSMTPAQKFGMVMKNVVGPALIGAGIAAGAMAAKFAVEGVQGAANLSEAINKANVVFGDAAPIIREYAKTANTALGSTEEAAIAAASQFAQFGKAAGLTGTELAGFSTDLTTLGTDLASFNNTPVDQAVTALGAALRGESEPLRKYGILLDDATLRQKAMEMGIYDGEGALTSQQKTLAAYQVILAQSGDAQGDFERTSGSLVNQQKILEASVTDLKTAFGVGFLGAIQDTDVAAGPGGLTSTIQELKPVIEDLGKAIGEGLVDLVKLIGYITDANDAFQEWKDTLEGTPWGAIFDAMGSAVKTLAQPLSVVIRLIEDLQRGWEWINSRSWDFPSLPSIGGYSSARPSVTAGPTVNVTVNGALDPVGTARSIRRVLGQADLRTGGGI